MARRDAVDGNRQSGDGSETRWMKAWGTERRERSSRRRGDERINSFWIHSEASQLLFHDIRAEGTRSRQAFSSPVQQLRFTITVKSRPGRTCIKVSYCQKSEIIVNQGPGRCTFMMFYEQVRWPFCLEARVSRPGRKVRSGPGPVAAAPLRRAGPTNTRGRFTRAAVAPGQRMAGGGGNPMARIPLPIAGCRPMTCISHLGTWKDSSASSGKWDNCLHSYLWPFPSHLISPDTSIPVRPSH